MVAAATAAIATPQSRIPPGYRFHPTDCEIISFLGILLGDDDRSKEEIQSLNVIQWVDVYSVQPWELYNMFYNHQVHIGNGGGDRQEEGYGGQEDSYLYFVSPLKKKTKNGTRIDRSVVVKGGDEGRSSVTVGTWKPQSGPINITDSRTGMPLGVKIATSFVPTKTRAMPEEDINEDDTIITSSNSSCSSKKRKKQAAPEEMQVGISYIMHQFTLCPADDQVYSLCRIRRKIDKKMMKTMIHKKKMRRSSSPTTNTTTYSISTVVQADQEERAAGYDHHQQEVLNKVSEILDPFCYNDGQQQQQEAVVPAERDVQISDYGKRSIQEIEEFLFTEEVAVPAATTRGGENNICSNDGQQQQEAVLLPEGDVQISDDDKGLANAMEDIIYCGVILNEEFLSRLEQDVEESNNKKGLVTL